jgi:putative ABC transport system permease protein
VIEVGGILVEARNILDQVSLAIAGRSGGDGAGGLAVLMGAIAAARAARIYDTVMLRVLGASRRQMLPATGRIWPAGGRPGGWRWCWAAGLAWLVITQLFEFDWLPDWSRILGVLGAGLVLVLGFAFAASLPVLRARPAQTLRTL